MKAAEISLVCIVVTICVGLLLTFISGGPDDKDTVREVILGLLGIAGAIAMYGFRQKPQSEQGREDNHEDDT